MAKAEQNKIKNTGTTPLDLADGRVLGPGEWAQGVDLSDPHNRALADAGVITAGTTTAKKES